MYDSGSLDKSRYHPAGCTIAQSNRPAYRHGTARPSPTVYQHGRGTCGGLASPTIRGGGASVGRTHRYHLVADLEFPVALCHASLCDLGDVNRLWEARQTSGPCGAHQRTVIGANVNEQHVVTITVRGGI